MLISIETLITCAFPGKGFGPPPPPLGPQMRISGEMFVCFDSKSLHPINNISDIKERVFLG